MIVQLRGINTIATAQDLVGHDVLIPEADLPLSEKDSLYFFQIEGFAVETIQGDSVGVVTDILTTADVDLLVISWADKERLIPFVDSICRKIQWDHRKIIIDPPEGLLNLNEI